MYWDNERDLEAHLLNTFILDKGVPVKVEATRIREGVCQVKTRVLGTDVTSRYRPLRLYDLSSMPLGYIKVGEIVLYISRKPCRRWKWGVTPESLVIPSCNYKGYNEFPWAMNKEVEVYFKRMVEGFSESVQGKTSGVVLSRHVAYYPDTRRIHYAGVSVGTLEKGKVVLDKAFLFLSKGIVNVTT